MKKTVPLKSLIKAKEDLELYIKVDQMKRLQKLFDPTFDVKELNSKIESKEDQLIIIKEAISLANATHKDNDGHTINYNIYLLSKYNRWKADLRTMQNRVNSAELLSDDDKLKGKLLTDIQDLDSLIEKETDKKKKSEHLSSKNKLKRTLTKLASNNKRKSVDFKTTLANDLLDAEKKTTIIKNNLEELNNRVTAEIELSEEFSIIVK